MTSPSDPAVGAPSVKAAWYGPWRLAGTVSRVHSYWWYALGFSS